ncbi:netrin receptor UNC5B-like [Anneissia japonica]|uniref:netrin receptor UNC5B-like n=1 Tax=Anneissia japonica TaxID=1529436 RepID=UPI0014259755|nr:netrin receptor UNC5B-like [Anneissia japonica]
MLMDQVPHNLTSYPGRGLGLLDHDVGHGTALEKMLRIFDQKISMYKLKDVTRINFSTSVFSAGIFDNKGGNLTLADAGVNLFIPPGAIPPRTRKEIYIYLDQNAHLKLQKKNETRISPIVHCGPPGTSFEAPFVLSFPHCAENENQWTFLGMIKGSSDSGAHWQNISDDRDGISFVQGGHCFIMVNHFTTFTFKGATRQQEGSKLINFCTFGKCYDRSNSYCFNVRAWNPHDKVAVLAEQHELQETRLDSIKTLSVQNTGKDVRVFLKNLKEGWTSEYENEMKISYEELWNELEEGSTPPSCRFRLKTKDSLQSDSVYCRVKSKQEGRKKEISLEVNPVTSQIQQNMNVLAMESLHPRGSEVDLLACRRMFGAMDVYELPEDVCYKLCSELNIKEANLRDWRGLAEQLNMDSQVIENLDKFTKSPTVYLFEILNIISAPGEFCKNLGEKLKSAKIESAYKNIKPYIKSQ